MTDSPHESINQPPATDVERTRVLASIIERRITELYTARARPGFTPAHARELFVLEQLRDDWLLEASV